MRTYSPVKTHLVQLGLIRANAKVDIDALFVLFGRERHGWRWIVLLLGGVTVLIVEFMVLLLVAAARGIALWSRGRHDCCLLHFPER